MSLEKLHVLTEFWELSKIFSGESGDKGTPERGDNVSKAWKQETEEYAGETENQLCRKYCFY